MLQDFKQSEDREFFAVPPGLHAFCPHPPASNPDKLRIGKTLAKLVKNGCTELIAGCFAGDQGDDRAAGIQKERPVLRGMRHILANGIPNE